MPKYFDEQKRYVIDEPSLLTISGSVDILYAGGTAYQDGNFTILIGNIESYNPTSLPSEPASEITPLQPENNEEPGNDNPTTPQNPGDDNPTTPQNPGNILWANETHNPGDVSSLSGTGWRSGYGDGGGNTPDGVRFVLTNNTGERVQFCGKFELYIHAIGSTEYKELFAHLRNGDREQFWMCNPYVLDMGDKAFIELDWGYNRWNNVASYVYNNLPEYLGWLFKSTETPGLPAIKLSHCVIDGKGETKVDDTPFIVHVVPLPEGTSVQRGNIYNLSINTVNKNPGDSTYNTSTIYPPTNN